MPNHPHCADIPCGNFCVHACFRLRPQILIVRITSFPRNSEINQFHLTCLSEQYVAGFNVPMGNRTRVQVLESFKDLMENPFRYQEEPGFQEGITHRIRGGEGSERRRIQQGCQRVCDVWHPHSKVARVLIVSQQFDNLQTHFERTTVSMGLAAYIWTRESRQEPDFLMNVVWLLRKLAVGCRNLQDCWRRAKVTIHR